MNIKALIPIVVGALLALVAWEMFLKKTLIKSDYDDEFYDADED